MSTPPPPSSTVKSGHDIVKDFLPKVPVPQRETKEGSVIVDEFVKAKGRVTQLPPLQKVAFQLTLIILAFIGIVVIGVGVEWSTQMPPVPDFATVSPDGSNTAVISDTNSLQLQQYRDMAEVAREGPLEFFDQVVVKVLFPLLTAVVGYLFGVTPTKQQ